jgi:Tol biopolymer transport system component
MSPEQVKGRGVDHRSDVFSFGCILYEAITRRKPFAADSDLETMHRILNDQPEPIEKLNPSAPAVLRRLVRRSLAKNPDQRFQSMKDMALELAEIAEEFEQLSTSDSGEALTGTAGDAAARARRRMLPLWAGIGIAVIAVIAIAFAFLRTRAPARLVNPETMKFTHLTTSGDIQQAALSSDGRYLAHVRRERGGYSLWVRQVATGSDVRIVEPLPTPFRGVSFSRDGNYVYYVNQETGGPGYSYLYQVPVLGGMARGLLFDIDTAVEFSPDGSQLAFIRGYPRRFEAALMIANADGTNEREVVALGFPEAFDLETPAWSPDGARIVVSMSSAEGGQHDRLVAVGLRDTSRTEFCAKRWNAINDVAWLPDGSGLVLTANEQPAAPAQLWLVSYPGGEVARITNDLNNYTGVSVGGDSRSLATAQLDFTANLWVAPGSDASAARQLTFGSGRADAIGDVAWTRAGSLVLQGSEGNEAHIWSADPDGSNRVRLTPRGTANFGPAVPRDADDIVFSSIREDGIPHLWRMDLDGGNPTQITRGDGEFSAGGFTDGRWATYFTNESALWKAPIAGGEAVKLGDLTLASIAGFSRDGRSIARDTYIEGSGGRIQRVMAIAPADGGPPTWTVPWPDGTYLRWHPSGEALAYIREVDGVGNVWLQPIDAGVPRQLTHFTSEELFGFAWTADGSDLYACRGRTRSDVVLIEEFR